MANAPIMRTSTERTTTVRQRMLVRRDPPVWPFIWRGLLPLLGLLLVGWFALMPFARGWIEDTTRREIRQALDAQGLQWVDVAVSGQHVTLSGTQPTAGAGDNALVLARAATCPTWAGRKVCAVSVVGQFTDPAPVAAAPPVMQASDAVACEKAFADILSRASIRFGTSSAEIDAASAPLLDRLAKAYANCPGVVVIEGHTDSRGLAVANQALSDARAASVREALVARGVPADRLEAKGFGPDRPVDSNDTAAGRARNRRIEFRAAVAR